MLGRPWIAEDSPLKLTQGKSLVNILKRNVYNTTVMLRRDSLALIAKEPWSACTREDECPCTVPSLSPQLLIWYILCIAVKQQEIDCNKLSPMEKIAREG